MALDLALPGVIGDFEQVESTALTSLKGVRGITEKALQNAVLQAVRQVVTADLFEKLKVQAGEVLENFQLVNGDREAAPDADEWDSSLDDEVMNQIMTGDVMAVMGAGFCGGGSVDTRLHEVGEVENFARKNAQEIAAELVAKNDELIIGYFDLRAMAAKVKEAATPAKVDENSKPVVVGVLRDALAIGIYGSAQDMAADIDLASDSDDILGDAALQRMGVEPGAMASVKAAFRNWRSVDAKFAVEAMDLAQGYQDVSSGTETPTPAAPAEAPVKPKRARKPKTASTEPVVSATQDVSEDELAALIGGDPTPPEPRAMTAAEAEAMLHPAVRDHVQVESVRGGTMDVTPEAIADKATRALQLLVENGPRSERDLADDFGVKRGTFNNIVKGKAKWEPTAADIEKLRGLIRLHLEPLADAAQMLS